MDSTPPPGPGGNTGRLLHESKWVVNSAMKVVGAIAWMCILALGALAFVVAMTVWNVLLVLISLPIAAVKKLICKDAQPSQT